MKMHAAVSSMTGKVPALLDSGGTIACPADEVACPAASKPRLRIFMQFSSLVVASWIAIFACGQGDEDQSDRALDEMPSSEILCSVILGLTTRDQVREAIGEPSSVMTMDRRTIVQYSYPDPTVPGQSQTLILVFDDGDIFESASAIATTVPYCWVEGPTCADCKPNQP